VFRKNYASRPTIGSKDFPLLNQQFNDFTHLTKEYDNHYCCPEIKHDISPPHVMVLSNASSVTAATAVKTNG
jgi:hypothetical protein